MLKAVPHRRRGSPHRHGARPLRDPKAIRALFAERLAALGDDLDPGFGFDLARLSVMAAEACAAEQIGIETEEEAPDLVRLVDCLSARLGAPRVRRPGGT